jgi:hypothetical protein
MRLNQEREQLLQPARMKACKEKLESLGFVVEQVGDTQLVFMFCASPVRFWPYSGWHAGKYIKDGRGFDHLLKQITP